MADINEKLNELRAKYKSPDNQQIIDDTEKNLRQLLAQKKYGKLPQTIALLDDARLRIFEINILLSYDEELLSDEVGRKALFKQRGVYEWFMERFGAISIDEQLDDIEKFVNDKL